MTTLADSIGRGQRHSKPGGRCPVPSCNAGKPASIILPLLMAASPLWHGRAIARPFPGRLRISAVRSGDTDKVNLGIQISFEFRDRPNIFHRRRSESRTTNEGQVRPLTARSQILGSHHQSSSRTSPNRLVEIKSMRSTPPPRTLFCPGLASSMHGRSGCNWCPARRAKNRPRPFGGSSESCWLDSCKDGTRTEVSTS